MSEKKQMSEIEIYKTDDYESQEKLKNSDSQSASVTAPLTGLYSMPPVAKTFTNAVVDALAEARTIGKKDEINDKLLRINDVEARTIDISASNLGPGEQKLLNFAFTIFTSVNGPKTKNPSCRVYGDTKEYARLCNERIDPEKKATPEEQEKENKRAAKALDNFKTKLRRYAYHLRVSGFRWKEKYNNKIVAYGELAYLPYFHVDDNTMQFEITPTVAEILVRRPIREYPRTIYAISEQNENAFAIATAMYIHYAIPNNVIAGTEQVLKVEKLLSHTSLGNSEGTKGRYRSRWESRIKEPFEAALDELTRAGFFHPVKDGESLHNWRYCTAGQVPLSDEDAESIISYEQWLSLYVSFELAGFSPHNERYREISSKKEEQKKKAANKRKKTQKAEPNRNE